MKILKRKKLNNGLTMIEIMTVIVIIGVLATIAISNFVVSSKKRAKEAGLVSNIRTLQVMLETYRVDWEAYPQDLAALSEEASKKNYNKSARNPMNNQAGPLSPSCPWAIDYADPADAGFNKILYIGKVGYNKVANNPTKYYLLAYDEDGFPLQREGKVYIISNGEKATP